MPQNETFDSNIQQLFIDAQDEINTSRYFKFFQKFGLFRCLLYACNLYNLVNLTLTKKSATDKTVLFIGTYFPRLYSELDAVNKYVLTVTPQTILQGIKNKLPVILPHYYLVPIYIELIKHSSAYSNKNISKFLYGLQCIIKKISPDIIILSNDVRFFARLVINIANNLNIPVLMIQDGIFSYKEDRKYILGKNANYIAAWSPYFKQLFTDRNIKPEQNIYVIGYPNFLPETNQALKTKDLKRICFLGQNWDSYGNHYKEAKLLVLRNFITACQLCNITFLYRCHPSEDATIISELIEEERIISRKETLMETINANDLFVSINSTSLVEAALLGKTGMQIYEPVFHTDYFNELGICHTVNNNVSEIQGFLSQFMDNTIQDFKLNENYIYVNANPAEQLNTIIQDIIGMKTT